MTRQQYFYEAEGDPALVQLCELTGHHEWVLYYDPLIGKRVCRICGKMQGLDLNGKWVDAPFWVVKVNFITPGGRFLNCRWGIIKQKPEDEELTQVVEDWPEVLCKGARTE